MTNSTSQWDDFYQQDEKKWAQGSDPVLEQYLSIIPRGNAIDLGCGQGRLSLRLAQAGFNVVGIDSSAVAINTCRQQAESQQLDVNFECRKIQEFPIDKNSYELICANWVLSYLSPRQLQTFISQAVSGLTHNGILYCNFFSNNDPFSSNVASDIHFYRLEQVMQMFSELRIIHVADVIGLDLTHDKPHYHGFIQYMGQKT